MSSYPTRIVGKHIPKHVDRLEVRSTTRRHRALVRGADAAVVLGVLGYAVNGPSPRVRAAEFVSRARTWLSRHDPQALPDPDAPTPVDWTPEPTSAQAYHRTPGTYRDTFTAFLRTTRCPHSDDWITWRRG